MNNSIPLTFPNGATSKIDKDILMVFECDSLENASPSFISNIFLVTTEETNVSWKALFTKEKGRLIQALKTAPFADFQLHDHFEGMFKDFVLPFVSKLCESRIKGHSFWQMKSLVIRFFKFLDGILTNLIHVEKEMRLKDDPVFLPIKSKGESISANLTLMAVVWSFGAILSTDMRKRFEDTFVQFRRKFDLKITGNLSSGSSSLGKNSKVSLFEMYFDLEKLQWDLVSERLGTRMSESYQSKNNNIVIPSLEIAQGLFLFDTLLQKKGYHIHFEGKSATQKTTVLTNITHKQRQNYRSIWVPMTASVTIQKSRKVFEQFYETSENRFVMSPIDSKPPLFIIDDLHLGDHLNSNFAEFFRMWDNYGGYYHLENGYFVNVEKLKILCSSNPKLTNASTNKSDRFTFYTNTIYFDDLDNDRFRIFIQNWLTNKSWNTSKLVNK